MTSVEMPALESSTTGELAAHAPLRIVHVTTTAVGGGAAKVMLDLASAQRAAGHEVLAISILPRTPPPAWFGPEHGQWSDVCHLEWFLRYDRPSNLWEARRRLRRELDRFRPDIVHSHLWVADIVTSLAVDRRSSQHLVHLHCRDTWKDSSAWKHRFRRAMTRQLFRRAHTRMIACSETVKEFEVRRMGWPADQIDVVRNAVDSQRFRPVSVRTSRRLRIGAAGWFIPLKEHRLLIDAVADLVAEQFDVELVIAGEGDLRKEYLQRAADRGISDRVSLPGALTDMASFYQSLDVFALPSSVEGLPLVVLEAMASGNGIVASALPGMEEAVRPEINGLLFPVGDRGALTAALRRVLTDRELSLRMGNASRNLIVQEFSSTFAATQTEAVYRRRLAERPGCRRP